MVSTFFSVYVVGSSSWFMVIHHFWWKSRPGSGRHPPHRPVWRAAVLQHLSCPTPRRSRSVNVARKIGFWWLNTFCWDLLGSVSIYWQIYTVGYYRYIMVYLWTIHEWTAVAKVERRCSAPFLLKMLMLLLLWRLGLTMSISQKKLMRCGEFLALGFVRFDHKRAWPPDCHSKGSS